MKKSIKIYPLVITAIMALGSVAFVSCDKEDDTLLPQVQSEQVAPKSLQFIVDYCFHDSMDRYWNISGTGSWVFVNGGRNGVYLNVSFRERGGEHTYYYKGKVVWKVDCRPARYTLIPDNDEPLPRLVWFVMGEFSNALLYGSLDPSPVD